MEVYWWAEIMTIITIPIYGVTILAEILISHYQSQKLYQGKDTFNNVFFTVLNFGVGILARGGFLFIMAFVYQYKIIHWEMAMWQQVLYWILVILLTDLAYWVVHWLGHMVRLFWAVHVIHHSSQEFNITIGFRSSVFEPLYRGLFFLPLALLGFSAADVMLAFAIQQLYGSLIHTKLIHKMGILEYFMVTPSHHRVHHGSNTKYLDKNMGMIFIFWDKIFNTFEHEDPKEAVIYGLTENYSFTNPLRILFAEFKFIWMDVKKAKGARNKCMYIFGPPGWSHDGSRKTSKQMQAEEKIRKMA